MKITYDHDADALYIYLTDKPVAKTRRVNDQLLLDMDDADQVIGIEILWVRASGIDPLTLLIEHYPSAKRDLETLMPSDVKSA